MFAVLRYDIILNICMNSSHSYLSTVCEKSDTLVNIQLCIGIFLTENTQIKLINLNEWMVSWKLWNIKALKWVGMKIIITDIVKYKLPP